jgi:hypothetical protein
MRSVRALVLSAMTFAAGALLGGCYTHLYYDYEAPLHHVHAHGDGCGHYYWHGAWRTHLHPDPCQVCIFGPSRATVYHASVVHVHAAGCGHYWWHDAWYDYPHPMGCGACVGVGVRVGVGYGWYHPRRAYHRARYEYCPPYRSSYRYSSRSGYRRGGRTGR